MTRPSLCPSRFALERFALAGEDPERSVAAHLSSCAACRSRVSELQELGQAYMSTPQALALRQALDAADANQASRRDRPSPAPWLWGGGLAAAAGLMLVVTLISRGPSTGELRGSPQGEDLVPKGAAQLALWVGDEGHADAALGDASILHPGARVQPVFGAPTTGFVALLLTTPAGEVIQVHPAGGLDAAPVHAGAPAPLGPSFRLDDEVGAYRVTAYFAEKPFPTAGLSKADSPQGMVAFSGRVLVRRFEVRR